MCGISGIFGRSDGPAVSAMVAAMHHRGPDDSGVFSDEIASIGMARLSILDLSAAGHQPMSIADGLVQIVYNGETYNFREERALLEKQGVAFRSHTDTEVLLRLYERYGDDFLLRLRGMFAIAIYDKRRGRGKEKLLLARDHLGVKPLLYARTSKGLLFASEMKAILASGLIARNPDPEAIRQLLTHGAIVQPQTAIEGVAMLLPGHRLIVDQGAGGKESIAAYWRLSPDRHPILATMRYDEQVDYLAEALAESVRLQMVSDVPVGAFLSGGVDSSLIVGLMTRTANRPIKTFSVGYAAQFSDIDETHEAARFAAFMGTDHTRVLIEDGEVGDHIERFANALDQPSVDGANSYFVSMAARRNVTVALSGTGGDELFAGYPWFNHMVLAAEAEASATFRRMAGRLIANFAQKSLFDRLTALRGGSRLDRLRRQGGFLPEYAAQFQNFSPHLAAKLLSTEFGQHSRLGRASGSDLALADVLPHGSPIQRVTALSTRGYLLNQLLRDIDAVSMAHSLEVRVPLVDPVIADIALALPDHTKLDRAALVKASRQTYAQSGAKKILIEAGVRKGLLAPDIAHQPKRGFGMPFGHWLNGVLAPVLSDTLSEQTVRNRGFFAPKEVARVHKDFREGRGYWSKAWMLMITELWCRTVVDAPSRSQSGSI